ncbi:MAG: hypothetical protein AAF206_06310 [Bacteroidota bacterium]
MTRLLISLLYTQLALQADQFKDFASYLDGAIDMLDPDTAPGAVWIHENRLFLDQLRAASRKAQIALDRQDKDMNLALIHGYHLTVEATIAKAIRSQQEILLTVISDNHLYVHLHVRELRIQLQTLLHAIDLIIDAPFLIDPSARKHPRFFEN